MKDIIQNPVEYAREVVGRDPTASFLGIVVEEAREAYARCSLTVMPEYLNSAKRAHGIIVHAVADQAFAVACNSMGTHALALHFSISYLSGALDGEKMVAEAVPVNIGRKVSVWKIDVRGSAGRQIASCEGIAYHK